MLVDLHAHRFWDDPKLEREETVSAGHEEMLAAMERANAEKLAKAEEGAPAKAALTKAQMMERAMERARALRQRALPPQPAAEAPPKAIPAPEKPAEAPAAERRPPPSGRPGRPPPIPPAGRDEDWEDVVSETYD